MRNARCVAKVSLFPEGYILFDYMSICSSPEKSDLIK